MSVVDPWAEDPKAMPDRATVVTFRDAISTALASFSAREVEAECVRYGLPPSAGDGDNPWDSKYR
jgi:hypothetical protein